MKTETTSDPAVHSRNIQGQLDELIRHTRDDAKKVSEPRFQRFWKRRQRFSAA
jgi:hypothetical protein